MSATAISMAKVRGGLLLKFAAWLLALALIALPVVLVVNGWLAVGNWPFKRLKVDGALERVSLEALRAAVAEDAARGFFAVDLGAMRTRIEALPWVETAEVRKRWPDLLELRVREFEPAARWNQSGLLSVHGLPFAAPVATLPLDLPQLSGPDARAAEVLARLSDIDSILAPAGLAAESLALSARGSWSLGLNNGAEIELGREQHPARLLRFLSALPLMLPPGQQLQWARVDLRYANGFSVAWVPAVGLPMLDARPAPDHPSDPPPPTPEHREDADT